MLARCVRTVASDLRKRSVSDFAEVAWGGDRPQLVFLALQLAILYVRVGSQKF